MTTSRSCATTPPTSPPCTPPSPSSLSEPPPLAEQWLAETGAHFTFLLDPARAAYHAYGLKRSVLRTWGWRNLSYYARQLFTGRKLRGIQGDAHQLGGDYLVDSTGIVRLAHPSHDPTDRPTIATLLNTLRALPHPAPLEVSPTP